MLESKHVPNNTNVSNSAETRSRRTKLLQWWRPDPATVAFMNTKELKFAMMNEAMDFGRCMTGQVGLIGWFGWLVGWLVWFGWFVGSLQTGSVIACWSLCRLVGCLTKWLCVGWCRKLTAEFSGTKPAGNRGLSGAQVALRSGEGTHCPGSGLSVWESLLCGLEGSGARGRRMWFFKQQNKQVGGR